MGRGAGGAPPHPWSPGQVSARRGLSAFLAGPKRLVGSEDLAHHFVPGAWHGAPHLKGMVDTTARGHRHSPLHCSEGDHTSLVGKWDW